MPALTQQPETRTFWSKIWILYLAIQAGRKVKNLGVIQLSWCSLSLFHILRPIYQANYFGITFKICPGSIHSPYFHLSPIPTFYFNAFSLCFLPIFSLTPTVHSSHNRQETLQKQNSELVHFPLKTASRVNAKVPADAPSCSL